jgi:hypothetical protein
VYSIFATPLAFYYKWATHSNSLITALQDKGFLISMGILTFIFLLLLCLFPFGAYPTIKYILYEEKLKNEHGKPKTWRWHTVILFFLFKNRVPSYQKIDASHASINAYRYYLLFGDGKK